MQSVIHVQKVLSMNLSHRAPKFSRLDASQVRSSLHLQLFPCTFTAAKREFTWFCWVRAHCRLPVCCRLSCCAFSHCTIVFISIHILAEGTRAHTQLFSHNRLLRVPDLFFDCALQAVSVCASFFHPSCNCVFSN